MAKSEKVKKKEEKNRAKVLRYLRKVYSGREKRRSESSSPEKSVNVIEDDTSSTKEFSVPPPVKFTTGHTTESIMNMANQSKMTVHKDPVGSSSLKRKADGHADAPVPKRVNTSVSVPRAPGERYQGTAVRPPPSSRPALERKHLTQQKARDSDTMNGETPSSLGKTKTVQQQSTKQANARNLDIPPYVGRKRTIEHDANERAAKKQRSTAPQSLSVERKRILEDDANARVAQKKISSAHPPLSPTQTQGTKTGKAAPSANNSVKAASTRSFFNSLYPIGSKVKASAGRSVVSTEIVRTTAPPTAVLAPTVKRTAPPKPNPVVEKARLPKPVETPNKVGNGPLTKQNVVSENSLKRKDRASE